MVKITSISKKGYGRTEEGVDIFGTIPGDEAEIEKPKRRRSRLLKIITPSPYRVEPRCQHAGFCGGCSFQQLAYEKQLEHKQNIVKNLFPDQEIHPIIPCDEPFGYRNKMEYTFSQNKAGERFLGLILAGTRGHVLNLEECHLTHPYFIDALKRVRAWWESTDLNAYHAHTDQGSLRTLTLRRAHNTGQTLAYLTVSGNSAFALNHEQLTGLKKALSPITDALFLRIQQAVKGQPTQFFEMHLSGKDAIQEILHLDQPYTFTISPVSFFQPNTPQAEKLYLRALELLAPKPTDILFDLYCGTGTLAIAFASHVKEAIGIELSPYAMMDAEQNLNGHKNVTFIKGDVGETLTKLLPTKQPDIVIVDPPRAGLDPLAIQHLLRALPQKILYISCNPRTQAENIEALSPHYTIKDLQPVDQFPHTPHLENIALLTKIGHPD